MQKRSKRLCLALAVLLSVSMVLVALVPAVEAASYKKGSSGAVVTQIQTKLKSWGYYTGTVDGIYGSGTERAVRAFQQKNGLTVDGKVRGRRQFQQFRRFRRRVQFAGRFACAPDLGGGPRRAVLRPGGRRRRRAQPHQAPVVPEYALRRHLSERRVHVHHGWAVQSAGRGERLPRRARCTQWRRSLRRRDLLFQSVHGHQLVDLVAAAHHGHREAPVLLLSVRKQRKIGDAAARPHYI